MRYARIRVPAPSFTDRDTACFWMDQHGYVYIGRGIYKYEMDIALDTAPFDYYDHYRIVWRNNRYRIRRQRFYRDGSLEASIPEELPVTVDYSIAPANAGAPGADREGNGSA